MVSSLGRRVYAIVLLTAGLVGAAWAVPALADVQVTEGQSTEALAAAAAAEPPTNPARRGLFGSWTEDILKKCECEGGCTRDTAALFSLPGCLARDLLNPCVLCEQGNRGALELALLAVVLAVLTSQAVSGYRRTWRVSFALFLVLFLGATVFDMFIGSDDHEGGVSWPEAFATIFFVSVLFAGVLAFWGKYMLELLVVIAGASMVGVFAAHLEVLQSVQTPLAVAVGVAGGVWLHWWRDHRDKKKRKAPDGGGQPPTYGGG